jgi:hypothetical protein
LREAKILRDLQHPNCVRLLELFRSKTTLFMVFEFVDRSVLRHLVGWTGVVACLPLTGVMACLPLTDVVACLPLTGVVACLPLTGVVACLPLTGNTPISLCLPQP